MIESHMNNISEILFNLLYIGISITISLLYWYKDNNKGIKHIVVSAHSVFMLILLGAALIIGFNILTHKLLLIPFYILLFGAVLSIVFSFKYFTGSKWLHLTHILNIPVLLWTYFVGSMALTGDWL